jgi:predicted lipoprotein with Yx(FWY)xxD motif
MFRLAAPFAATAAVVALAGGVAPVAASATVPAVGRTAPVPPPPPFTVQLEDGPTGRVLADLQGHTLYRDDQDTATAFGCTGTCTDTRKPLPYHVGEALRLPPGIAGTLGSVRRPDGTGQITYEGAPLYWYTGDQYTGDANGDGGHWHAVKPRNAPGS